MERVEPVTGQAHVLRTFCHVQAGEDTRHFVSVHGLDAPAVSFLVEQFKPFMPEAEYHAVLVSVTYHYSLYKDLCHVLEGMGIAGLRQTEQPPAGLGVAQVVGCAAEDDPARFHDVDVVRYPDAQLHVLLHEQDADAGLLY